MTNGLSVMGYGLPAAISAKLLRPDQHVVAMVGDGGFAMVAGEMQVAAERRLGLVVVVFCDGSLNRIELKQKARKLPSTATRIGELCVAEVAASFGCDGVRVHTAAQLDGALAGAAYGLSRPLVIEARINPAQYLSQF